MNKLILQVLAILWFVGFVTNQSQVVTILTGQSGDSGQIFISANAEKKTNNMDIESFLVQEESSRMWSTFIYSIDACT